MIHVFASCFKKMIKFKKWAKKSPWDTTLLIFGFLSEAANIGIVIEIVAKWWPALLTLGHGLFSYIVFYSDPIIYFFKALYRVTRITGRKYFNISFEEEKNGVHPWQTAGDILSLSLYVLAIPFFFGAVISGPIGITVGWSIAFCGLSVVAFFDYRYQTITAKQQYELAEANFMLIAPSSEITPELTAQNTANEKKKSILYEEYKNKRNSYYSYLGLLFGLACLLICGSAALCVPAATASVLHIISKTASVYLAGIALVRFKNWLSSSQEESENDISENGSLNSEEESIKQQDSTVAALAQLKPGARNEQATTVAPVHTILFGSTIKEAIDPLTNQSSISPGNT